MPLIQVTSIIEMTFSNMFLTILEAKTYSLQILMIIHLSKIYGGQISESSSLCRIMVYLGAIYSAKAYTDLVPGVPPEI